MTNNKDLLRRAAKAAGLKTLHMALKGEYFDAIKAGHKTEEYRLVTPHWTKRLRRQSRYSDSLVEGSITVDRYYDQIILTRGYPKRDDGSRRLVLPWRGYDIKTITHPHFGDKPVQVYAIVVRAAALLDEKGDSDG